MQVRRHKLRFSDLTNPWQRFRSQTGMLQAELAEPLGVRQTAISVYEGGTRFPAPVIAKRFVEYARKRKIRMSMDEVYAKLEV